MILLMRLVLAFAVATSGRAVQVQGEAAQGRLLPRLLSRAPLQVARTGRLPRRARAPEVARGQLAQLRMADGVLTGEAELATDGEAAGWIADEIAAAELRKLALEQELSEDGVRAERLLEEVDAEVHAPEDGLGGDGLPEFLEKMSNQCEQPDKSPKGEDATKKGTKTETLPILAVVGRPNTGKSTIFNRLTGAFQNGAIVHDEAGITRDRTYRPGSWLDYNFQVVDTGGIVFDDTEDNFASQITEQALLAVEEASALLMVVDGQDGPTPLDEELAAWLRRHNRAPVFLLVNKCESHTLGDLQAANFWTLGLGEPYPVSGLHGTGLADVLDTLTSKHLKKITIVDKDTATNVAFVGRPNVGKSSLFNKFMRAERAIVSDVAGTTRDPIDSLIVRTRKDGEKKEYRIVDTAGIRKKQKIQFGAEFFMINRAFKAIKRADCVVLMLDATEGIVDQELQLAERIIREGRSCVIALNKWDLVADKDDSSYNSAICRIRESLPNVKWAPVVLTSAETGQRTEKLLEAVDASVAQFNRRVTTNVLNEVINDAVLWKKPPTAGRSSTKSGRIYYAAQVSTAPPTFVLFCNDPKVFPDNYKRYLERKVRESLGFEGTPIRLYFKGKKLRELDQEVSRNAKRKNT